MRTFKTILIISLSFFILSCGGGEKKTEPQTSGDTESGAAQGGRTTIEDSRDIKGVGPISSVDVGEDVDQMFADMGKQIFEQNCIACHKIDKKFIGPALKGVTERRSPEWIMNMIMDPEGMTKNDPIAKELLKKYMSPMANQGIKKDQARKILEYFRSIDQ